MRLIFGKISRSCLIKFLLSSVSTDFIIFSSLIIYCLSTRASEEVSDGPGSFCDFNSEIILYLASSQAPKSISLHRCEQNGEYFTPSDGSGTESSTVFLQIGHLYFMAEHRCFLVPGQIVYFRHYFCRLIFVFIFSLVFLLS